MSTQKKWTREQQLKWQRECILEDFSDILREKGVDQADTYTRKRREAK